MASMDSRCDLLLSAGIGLGLIFGSTSPLRLPGGMSRLPPRASAEPMYSGDHNTSRMGCSSAVLNACRKRAASAPSVTR